MSNIINCHCFLQLQLLYIKQLRLMYVTQATLYFHDDDQSLSQYHLIDHKDCNSNHIIVF